MARTKRQNKINMVAYLIASTTMYEKRSFSLLKNILKEYFIVTMIVTIMMN